MTYRLYQGDCLAVLPTLAAQSVDAVITDPPYAEIDRDYGRLTEAQWWDLMMGVCKETRRVLKPTGSAVFILQPNSRKVGSMRGWLWEFMAWVCREWNMVQDVWWWNYATPPTVHTHEANGLSRPSLKACVWAGGENCYRKQSNVLLPAAEASMTDKRITRHDLGYSPSGLSMRHGRALEKMWERGGATPFNVWVGANSDSSEGAGTYGHGAGTPLKLADWWVRYIAPRGGVVLDPFNGSGTMGIAALQNGCNYIGIEQMPEYVTTSRQRLDAANAQPPLFVADAPAAIPAEQATMFAQVAA